MQGKPNQPNTFGNTVLLEVRSTIVFAEQNFFLKKCKTPSPKSLKFIVLFFSVLLQAFQPHCQEPQAFLAQTGH